MRLIQILLVLTAALAIFSYLRFFRSVLRDRLIACVIFVLAVFSIIFPDFTTWTAHQVGVGRGTDLILYIVAVGSAFGFILIYTKISKNEEDLTKVVRHLATKEARRPRD